MSGLLNCCTAILAIGCVAVPTVAEAALVVSAGATKNVTCTGGVCSATAKKAVLNASDLANMLGSGTVKLVPGKKAQDIQIKAPVSWANKSRLTLDAYRGIEVDQPVTLAGTGALTATTNDGGKNGAFLVTGKGYVKFWDTHSKAVINGGTYTLETTISDLAAAISANPSGNFALAASYDAKNDGTYAASPIGCYYGSLGRFEGFGNTIDHLKVNGPSNGPTGFFACNTGSIENLGITNATVSGGDAADVGILAGYVAQGGQVFNVYTSGSVTAGNSTSSVITHAGGLLGALWDPSTVANSHSSAKVIAGGSTNVGGLIGAMGSASEGTGSVVNSYATGNVTAGDNILGQYQGPQVGGLIGTVGSNGGPEVLSGDYASGTVMAGSGNAYAGGLVGNLYGPASVILSHASGSTAVGAGSSTNGFGIAGGLIGQLYPSSTATPATDQSYATGAVSCGDYCDFGGLFGYSLGQVTNSYATGAVSANGSNTIFIGGLAGYTDAYASMEAITTASYSIGAVQGNGGTTAGGFAGAGNGTQTSDDWDTDTSGMSNGCGYPQNCAGVTGLTTTQLQSQLPNGFSSKIWALDPKKNYGFPYLLNNPPAK